MSEMFWREPRRFPPGLVPWGEPGRYRGCGNGREAGPLARPPSSALRCRATYAPKLGQGDGRRPRPAMAEPAQPERCRAGLSGGASAEMQNLGGDPTPPTWKMQPYQPRRSANDPEYPRSLARPSGGMRGKRERIRSSKAVGLHRPHAGRFVPRSRSRRARRAARSW